MPELELAAPHGSIKISVAPGQRLSEAIWLSGKAAPNSLCAGLGQCGRCRVRYKADAPEPCLADRQRFSAGELQAGWRLACRHTVPDCAELSLFAPCLQIASPAHAKSAQSEPAWLGIDLGTTSIQWRALGSDNPDLAHGSLPNPQAASGADVISRLAFALRPGGLAILTGLARQALAEILQTLAEFGFYAERICVAANSVMTEILLGNDVAPLAEAPYRLDFHGGVTVVLDLPGHNRPVPTVIPPLPAAFIGGDISAGLLALADAQKPFILSDMGTNAELALLGRQGQLFFASAPLGPALEGIGPACGQPAEPGAITGFQLGPTGLIPRFYDESCPAEIRGISATGYISLLALLLNLGLLLPNGQFGKPDNPLAGKVATQISGARLKLPGGHYLAAHDVELLLKVKAAFRLALDRLLAASSLSISEIAGFYLAGSLGACTSAADLATLGFLPTALAKKASGCGNSSLAGACMLAKDPDQNAALADMCAKGTVIQPADDADFMAAFINAMQWGNHAAC